MFTVQFYQFSKTENSTARPTTAAVEFSTCQIKAPFSVLNPSVSVMNQGAEWNPCIYNYCYIPSFNRYYYVTDWLNSGPLWTASLKVDTLATYRTEIGAFNTYVYRSSYEFDGKIKDSMYGCKSDVVSVEDVNVPSPFSINNTANEDIFFVTVLGGGIAFHYIMTFQNLVLLLNEIFSDDYFDEVLTDFGATEYPEAKVAVNPLQYISSVKLLRGKLSDFYTTSTPVDSIKVGTVLVQPHGFSAYFSSSTTIPLNYVISRPNHPQSSRGVWMNSDPQLSSYELFIPPFGLITLDSADVGLYDKIKLYFTFDGWNCNANLRITAYNSADMSGTEHTVAEYTRDIGMSIPISGIVSPWQASEGPWGDAGFRGSMMNYGNLFSIISPLLGAVTSGNPAQASSAGSAAVSAFSSTASTMMQMLIPHLSTGSAAGGTLCNCVPKSVFTARFLSLVDEDLGDIGRPLMSNRTISNIPGFIICNPEHFAIPGYREELMEVQGYLGKGFYYV